MAAPRSAQSARLVLLLLLTATPASLAGQLPNTTPAAQESAASPTPGSGYGVPRGLWLSAGPGYGWVSCGNNGCTMDAPTGNVEGGHAGGPSFCSVRPVLGWTKADETISITNGMIRFSAGPGGQGNPLSPTARQSGLAMEAIA